jgi:hypothetical protein
MEDGHVAYLTFAVSDVFKMNISGSSNNDTKVVVVAFDGVKFAGIGGADGGVGGADGGGGTGGTGGASASGGRGGMDGGAGGSVDRDAAVEAGGNRWFGWHQRVFIPHERWERRQLGQRRKRPGFGWGRRPIGKSYDYLDYSKSPTNYFEGYIRGISNQLRAWNMGSFYWPGLRDGDWYSMTIKSGTGANITLSIPNKSGLERLQYAWGPGATGGNDGGAGGRSGGRDGGIGGSMADGAAGASGGRPDAAGVDSSGGRGGSGGASGSGGSVIGGAAGSDSTVGGRGGSATGGATQRRSSVGVTSGGAGASSVSVGGSGGATSAAGGVSASGGLDNSGAGAKGSAGQSAAGASGSNQSAAKSSGDSPGCSCVVGQQRGLGCPARV